MPESSRQLIFNNTIVPSVDSWVIGGDFINTRLHRWRRLCGSVGFFVIGHNN